MHKLDRDKLMGLIINKLIVTTRSWQINGKIYYLIYTIYYVDMLLQASSLVLPIISIQ